MPLFEAADTAKLNKIVASMTQVADYSDMIERDDIGMALLCLTSSLCLHFCTQALLDKCERTHWVQTRETIQFPLSVLCISSLLPALVALTPPDNASSGWYKAHRQTDRDTRVARDREADGDRQPQTGVARDR